MLKTGTILTDLYESILPEAKNRKVADLRIGLGYIGVRLDNDSQELPLFYLMHCRMAVP